MHRRTRRARPGERRESRAKGTPNKVTQARILGFERAGASVELATKPSRQQPLDFLINMMDDETQSMAVRVDAAKSAAPYVHFRKVVLVDLSGHDQPQIIQTLRFGEAKPKTIEHDPQLPPTSH